MALGHCPATPRVGSMLLALIAASQVVLLLCAVNAVLLASAAGEDAQTATVCTFQHDLTRTLSNIPFDFAK